MNHKINQLIIIALISVIILSGCNQTGKDVIRVATDATWPPFEAINQDTGEMEGFDIDLINAIAKKAGLNIEIINISFETLLNGMIQCQYDAAVSAITITADREADFAFSDPYFAAGQVVVVRIDNNDIKSHSDLGDKHVGVQQDTTGDVEAQKIANSIVHRYDDIEMAFTDLMNSQIDAVIADYPAALQAVGRHPDQLRLAGNIFTEENYGIAVCKSNKDLVNRINTALAELKAEGYIDDLTQIWIGGNNP